MIGAENSCAKAEQPYYSEKINQLSEISELIGKQVLELETRIKAVLCNGAPTGTPKTNEVPHGGPSCALDQRLDELVAGFALRREQLAGILRRIRL